MGIQDMLREDPDRFGMVTGTMGLKELLGMASRLDSLQPGDMVELKGAEADMGRLLLQKYPHVDVHITYDRQEKDSCIVVTRK